MKTGNRFRTAALLIFAGIFAACEPAREITAERHSVALEGASTAEVDLRMNAGELSLRGRDQASLLEATFRYNRDRLKPRLDYHLFNEKGILRVDQGRSSGVIFGSIRNEWDLSLSRSVPTDLSVNLGAGESDLDLRGIDLTDLRVKMGVGQMTLDLQGPRERSLDVQINGGVGSGTIYLPSDVGVRVKVDGGLGSITVRGLTKRDDVYTNEAYRTSEVRLEIDIKAGIGSLTLSVGTPGRSGI
jgi:hypothetical protein